MSHLVKGYVEEIKSIDVELKQLRKKTKELNQRKKDLELKIIDYLKEKGQPGVKYNGVAIVLHDKNKTKPKKAKEKREEVLALLESHGLDNAEDITDELFASIKGEQTTYSGLKIQTLKD